MLSKMYRNTGRLLPDVADNLVFRDNKKGYSPLYGLLDTTKNVSSNKDCSMVVDSLKLSYLGKMIELCKKNDITLVCMISPRYNFGDRIAEYDPAFSLCERKGVPVCDYLNDSNFVVHPELFQDAAHLNHKGAVIYTQLVVKDVLKNKLGK